MCRGSGAGEGRFFGRAVVCHALWMVRLTGSVVMIREFVFRGALLLSVAAVLAGCQGTDGVSTRTAVLTGAGATAGGAIGAQQGGTQGAVLGSIIGGGLGFLVGSALDEMERQQIEAASLAAARSNRVQTRSFRNSKGQRVRTTTRPVRTYRNSSGASCRQVSTEVVRDGEQAASTSATACQVRVGRGLQWKEMS